MPARPGECLAKVTRGERVESIHRGALAAATGDGKIVAGLGDVDWPVFIRSTSKPFQAIPVITSGAAAHFGFTKREIAVMCGSHNGEPVHTETVTSILKKIG